MENIGAQLRSILSNEATSNDEKVRLIYQAIPDASMIQDLNILLDDTIRWSFDLPNCVGFEEGFKTPGLMESPITKLMAINGNVRKAIGI